jgi:DNA-directed RNA polymerase subunit alpha
MQVTRENLKINTVKESKNVGTYAFEPLPTGFGYTLANALRRILLSSIPGAAPTQAKIKGVNHQFTTLKGVKEDVVELTLNLKRLRFKLYGENPAVVTISKKGSGKVTASDIKCPSEVEVLEPKAHIATLSDSKSSLDIELVIEPGTGYSPMEDRETSKVGVIVLDALFSPVVNVNYEVEPARFGEKTDLDKIIITVETDGSIAPKEAVMRASAIAANYFEAFAAWEEDAVITDDLPTSAIVVKPEDVAVDELPLQTRTINALKKHGVETLDELSEKSDEEIADIKNLGEKSLKEIRKLLEKEGLRE